ncbi:MAG: LLM class flavin-dependent oxidoreductase [Actinomycetota bacterium]|nr:LLM class flavin-dependent oxidoreductase [Actinomycetota bacterium]
MNGLGVSLASRSGLSASEVAEHAQTAEQAGFEAVFVSERCADGMALAHSALQATTSVGVGTGIANARLRHPVLTALTAATLTEESGGRFVLGLGVANPALNERALGLPAVRPLPYMREYVGVLRAVLAGDPESPGEYFSGSGFVPDRRPMTSVPIFLAGLLPKMLALAGEIGDGVLLNLMTTAGLPKVSEHIAVGLARAGRSREDVVVACLLPCCISSDAEAAARAARQVVAGYAMHPAAGQLFTDSGFADVLLQVRERTMAGDKQAADSVSDEMIDALVAHGEPGVLPERIQAYRDAGVDLPVLFPMPVDDGWSASIHEVISAAAISAAKTPESAQPHRKDTQHV